MICFLFFSYFYLARDAFSFFFLGQRDALFSQGQRAQRTSGVLSLRFCGLLSFLQPSVSNLFASLLEQNPT